jgi:uncharacterized protein (DUF58 family)
MTTVKARLYLAIVGAVLVVGVAAGRPGLVAVAAPFAVALVVGMVMAHPPGVEVELRLGRERVLEGEPVDIEVDVVSPVAVPRLDLAVGLSEWLAPEGGRRAWAVALAAGDPAPLRFAVTPERWGAHWVGPVAWRAHDVAGLWRFEGGIEARVPLRAYPRQETLRALVAPAETQVFTGNRRARVRGEGIEFAELRPFVTGDRARAVNWRVAARGGGLWVNERHPERNSDVVLFLDTFGDALLGRAVRAAAALVEGYGAERDRVGLVDFGGSMRWVRPGAGPGHLHRITEALIDTQVYVSYAWRGIEIVPARTLPPKALVLAVSPLEDERVVTALADLRGRRVDLVVVEVAPDAPAPATMGRLDALGERVWRLEREARRARFRRLGVPVVEWAERAPLTAVMEEVGAWRRRARRRAG